MNVRLVAIVLMAALLHACVSAPSSTGRKDSSLPYPTGSSSPVERDTQGVREEPEVAFIPPFGGVPTPLENEPVLPPSFPKSAEEISGQAVVSLMRQSNEARSEGKWDLAASLLERAQRIEPRNYFVWSALAKVYLGQDQLDQAISVAGKSNSLARGNVYVELENWKTIAQARRANGDSIGALQAEARVDEIERLLESSKG